MAHWKKNGLVLLKTFRGDQKLALGQGKIWGRECKDRIHAKVIPSLSPLDFLHYMHTLNSVN